MDIKTKQEDYLILLIEQLKKENDALRRENIDLRKKYADLLEKFRKVGAAAFKSIYN